MRRAKSGLRALGLSFLAVLGLMAFGAVGAQGQAPGKFLDAGGELAVGTTFAGTQEGSGSLLIPTLGVAVECTAIDIEEGVVTAKQMGEVGGTAHAKLKLLNCIVLTSTLKPTKCTVEGGFIVARVKLLARRASAAHANVPFVLVEPLEGTTIELVKIIGLECAIAGTYNVTGTIAYKVLAGNNNPQLLVPYTNQALLGDSGIKFGVHASTMDRSFTLQLTGPGALAEAAWGVC